MRRAALTILAALVLSPVASATAATSTVTTKLTLTAPAFLTHTATTATPPATTATATTSTSTVTTVTTPLPSGDLPYTGDDLLPEAIGAVVLIGAGLGIRMRLRWR